MKKLKFIAFMCLVAVFFFLSCISCNPDFKDGDYWIIVEKSKYEYSTISEKTYEYILEKYRKHGADNYFECYEYFVSKKSYEIGDTLFFNK